MVKLCLIFASVLALTVASLIANAQEPAKETTAAAPKTDAATSKPKKSDKKHEKKTDAKDAKAKGEELPKEVKKLIVQDMIQGTGKVATRGKTLKVNYTGWLYESDKSMGRGKQFDTSVGGEPFPFKLGAGEVIKGWDEGFADMKVGGKRKLIIPPELGYGANGAGSAIPPNASLMFEVELIDVQ